MFHAAKPHQGANRWLGNPARVCRRGTDYFLRCNALCLLHPTMFHCVAKPRHHIQSANVRIRCAIRTYDSITPGDYGFPHPDPLPRGEGANSRELQAGASEIKRKGAGQAPFDTEMQRWLLCVMWTRSRITTANGILTHVVPYRLVAAFIPSTNSFRRVSICSGFWWWVSMIFTTAEPEMAPAAPAAIASRT